MLTRFKDRMRQKMYDACRAAAENPASEFWHPDGKRRTGASHRNAYWAGRDGKPSPMPRNSIGYAAWAAGRDDLRASKKVR